MNDNLYSSLYADYFSQAIAFSTVFNNIGKNYIAALGFTPRLYNFDAARDATVRMGYLENTSSLSYSIYPKDKSLINTHLFQAGSSVFLNENGSMNEVDLNAKYSILFANRRLFYIGYTQTNLNLPFLTDIFSGLNEFKPQKYNFGYFTIDLESNFLKPFSWILDAQSGGYFNGHRFSLTGSIKQRIQPWVNLELDLNYNYITVLGKSVNPYIIAPTFEVDFNKNLFWTIFAQYNTNISNFNINNRIQWHFRPLSDIYLVYASNYQTPNLTNNKYMLTLKIVYLID